MQHPLTSTCHNKASWLRLAPACRPRAQLVLLAALIFHVVFNPQIFPGRLNKRVDSNRATPLFSLLVVWRHSPTSKVSPPFLSTPPASFNHFVQFIIAVIAFPDFFFPLVLQIQDFTFSVIAPRRSFLSIGFVAQVPYVLFMSIHERRFLSSNCALISAIHTVKSLVVNVSRKAILALCTL